jgi:hypothetical protein
MEARNNLCFAIGTNAYIELALSFFVCPYSMLLKHIFSAWLLGCSAKLRFEVGRGVLEADAVHLHQLIPREVPGEHFVDDFKWSDLFKERCFN